MPNVSAAATSSWAAPMDETQRTERGSVPRAQQTRREEGLRPQQGIHCEGKKMFEPTVGRSLVPLARRPR
jgi:hypothetical protein